MSEVRVKNIYDAYANKSFIDAKNFNYNIYPKDISVNNLFVPSNKLKDFYSDSIMYLHLFSGLYTAIIKYNEANYNNINSFKNLITNLKISIVADNTASNSNNISYLIYTSNLQFNLYALNNNWGIQPTNTSNISYYDLNYRYKDIYPILGANANENNVYGINAGNIDTIQLYNNNNIYNDYALDNLAGLSKSVIETRYSTQKNSPYNSSDTYTNDKRYNKLIQVLYGILSQEHENILGYLLYYKIYYHIIVYNCTIQKAIRENYLNLSTSDPRYTSLDNLYYKTDSGTPQSFLEDTTNKNAIIDPIIDAFNKMKDNVNLIKEKYFRFNNDDYKIDKIKYTEKIAKINALKDDFLKNLDLLNKVIKSYNQYIINIASIKSYAVYIILFLIVLIIATIVITLLPNKNNTLKNYYYLIAFIVLSFIIYIYYDNFKFINIYERFSAISYVPNADINLDYTEGIHINRKNNHITVYNAIRNSMNDYNEAIKKLFDILGTNIYTVGNKVFTQDADNYLYKLYLEKSKQNEANRLKMITLNNSIEAIKRQIIFIFNIILVISFLTIILLLALLLYINMPFYLNYIIALSVILIIIVVVFFLYSIIQPTRMIANKNYWANVNPSKQLISKL